MPYLIGYKCKKIKPLAIIYGYAPPLFSSGDICRAWILLCYNRRVGANRVLPIFLILLLAASGLAADWRIEVGSSSWGLAPFNSLLEKRAVALVRAEAERLVGGLFPGLGLETSSLTAVSTSSGSSFSLAVWRRLNAAWALGMRLEKVDYRIPMQVASRHRVTFLGQSLFPVDTEGLAELRINTLLPALVLRWGSRLAGRMSFSGLTGLAYLPLRGCLDYRTEALIPIDDELRVALPLALDSPLAELRRDFSSLPAGILFPFLEARLEYGFSRYAGLFVGLTLGSGISAGGGLFFLL